MGLPSKELKNNLLGALEVALFMHEGPKRFGNTRHEAVQSFFIPALLFPASVLGFSLSGAPDIIGAKDNTLLILLSLRLIFVWVAFFGTVAWVLKHVDHMDNFYRFVIATNWITIPSTFVLLPVFWMIVGGGYSWDEIYPFVVFLMLYGYALMAYAATYALVIPWELSMFITMIAIVLNNGSVDLIHWVGRIFA